MLSLQSLIGYPHIAISPVFPNSQFGLRYWRIPHGFVAFLGTSLRYANNDAALHEEVELKYNLGMRKGPCGCTTRPPQASNESYDKIAHII